MIDASFQLYQRAVLEAWRQLQCTRGRPSSRDRALVRDLYGKGVTLNVILVAFRLAALRRSPDLPPVRSIAYFESVINELAHADPAYIDYLNAHT